MSNGKSRPTRWGRRRAPQGNPLISALFFPGALLWHELLLRAFDRDVTFFSPGLLRVVLFSLSMGFFVFLLLDLIPAKKFGRIAGGVLMFAYIVVLCVERGMKSLFSMYYGVIAAAGTAGDAVGNFTGDAISVVISILPFILLSLLPFAAYILLSRSVIYEKGQQPIVRVLALALTAVFYILGYAASNVEPVRAVYTYDFSTNNAIPEFGLAASVRLELQYALFGTPEADLDSFIEEPGGDFGPGGQTGIPVTPDGGPDDPQGGGTPEPGGEEPGGEQPGNEEPGGEEPGGEEPGGEEPGGEEPGGEEPGGEEPGGEEPGGEEPGDEQPGGEEPGEEPGGEEDPPVEPVVYGYNMLDIDFASLAQNATDKTIKSMHEYFGSLTPTQQNAYTGMFAGKNLIVICAESFHRYAIDPELTPTLYRMTQEEGFVFTNFYQPDWSLSTCGGEFSVTTGLIPNWINKSDSARRSIGNDLTPVMGNMFRAAGYNVKAWHNNTYTYYNRDKYLPAFGYDYKGIGNGLELTDNAWPRSDREMIEVTCDEYINEYVENGTPFHAYYMSVSGHGSWSFNSNARSKEYRDLVKARYPDLSEPCQAYLACNIDLDRALEVLVDRLEAAGIADDTLIVMAPDHYPYMLNTGDSIPGDTTDYFNELNRYFGEPEDSEMVTSRYRTTLLMWSGSLPRTVVNTPCYSCDIVPTVLNLFGLEYDSRLYSGRDIFAENWQADTYSSSMSLVVFVSNHGQGCSWISAAGTYEASTKKFTPNEGITVASDYVKRVNNLVAGRIQYAKLIITEDYYSTIFG